MIVTENKRPYCIINGINSKSIRGLIITKLPPITKPPKRYRAETIDGRDGEIITLLGWGSYDKDFEIGLSYDYDLDEIIGYFSQSGDIIFSNEPDKVYKFKSLKEIDFNKLYRFKKAKITYRFEPFKFSDSESPRIFESESLTACEVRNNGNIFSRPDLSLTGVGNVALKINNKKILDIDFGASGDTYLISSVNMDAETIEGYSANRAILGNYDKIKLEQGKNKISFTGGTVTRLEVSDYSRWI
jgi:phage-related protein